MTGVSTQFPRVLLRPKCRGAREHRDLDLYSHLMPGGEDEALALVDAY